MVSLVNKVTSRGSPPAKVERYCRCIPAWPPKRELVDQPTTFEVKMRHRTPEFEAPAMHETQLLFHLREQVSRKTRHILGNLVEAEHDPPKIISSLLRVYEKKLGTYYQEYAKFHQEILDRIPALEFKEQEELQMDFYRLHTEALLRIEQLSGSLAGKYDFSENERLVLESFQSMQLSEPTQEEQSDKLNVVPSHHVATTGSNVETIQEEHSNRSSVTPTNDTVTPTQPPAKSQSIECRAFDGFHNRHQEKSVLEELYDSSSLEPPAISETSKDERKNVHREHNRSSCTKEPRHTTRCGVPSTEDRQGADWKRTSLRAEFIPTKLFSQSCVQLSSGNAIPVQVFQLASKDWRSSGRLRIRQQSHCCSEELSDALRIVPSTQRVRSDHQPKNAQKEHCKPVSIQNHRQLEFARVEQFGSPSHTVKSDESGAPGRQQEVDHRHRSEPAQKNSNQPRVEPYANVHSTTPVDHPESIRKEHSKLTSFKQLRRVETSTETMTVAAVKYPELAQEKISGPFSVEQPVHTATFVVGSDFTTRMQTRSSGMELTNHASCTIVSTASTRESVSAQEELSDLSCVEYPLRTATSAVEPESVYKPRNDDLPESTAENSRHVKIAQDKPSHVKPLSSATAAIQWEIVLDEARMLLHGKLSLVTVLDPVFDQVESVQVEPSKLSPYVKISTNPAMFPKGTEAETMECGTLDIVKLTLDTAARVMVFDSNCKTGKFRDLQRSKTTFVNDSRSSSEMIVERFSPARAGHAGAAMSTVKEMYCVMLPTEIVHHQPILNSTRKMETECALFG
ncbi:uncharacterized protein LOC134292172 [Aedes albopictus]|uniref:Uncharacterized protein n=1 Tax=Aedes albopictus TaxID=7160 RepID=A0ABM2A110_AEDAL